MSERGDFTRAAARVFVSLCAVEGKKPFFVRPLSLSLSLSHSPSLSHFFFLHARAREREKEKNHVVLPDQPLLPLRPGRPLPP